MSRMCGEGAVVRSERATLQRAADRRSRRVIRRDEKEEAQEAVRGIRLT